MSHIMVYGNPCDGFRFVGPFATRPEAYAYAAAEGSDRWVAELDGPTSFDIARKTWDIRITKTNKGYAWTTDFAGDGFDPTADAMVVAIAKVLTAYIEPAINRSIITDLVALGEKVRRERLETKPTAVEDYAAWLARQPKPKTMAEALAQLPPGVTGFMMDPDKPEVVHNAVAEAVGEAPVQPLPPITEGSLLDILDDVSAIAENVIGYAYSKGLMSDDEYHHRSHKVQQARVLCDAHLRPEDFEDDEEITGMMEG